MPGVYAPSPDDAVRMGPSTVHEPRKFPRTLFFSFANFSQEMHYHTLGKRGAIKDATAAAKHDTNSTV
jgi:hypothetical protein